MQWYARLTALLAARSSTLNTELVAALERIGRPGEWNLSDSDVRRSLGVTEHELFPACAREYKYSGKEAVEPFAWERLSVFDIPDALLDAQSGLTFIGNRVVTQSNLGFRDSRDSAFITGATRRALESSGESDLPIASLGRSDNFYHFMVESVPRIVAIRSIEPKTLFLTAVPLEPFVASVASMLNLNVELLPQESLTRSSNRVFVTTPPQLRRPSPGAIQLVKQAFSAFQAPTPTAKVYVSRRSSSRSFPFESELEKRLQARGFDILRLEELELGAQIEAMSRAQVVVAPHGAGLTHMLFMHPKTRVIELATNTHWHESFRNLGWLQEIDFTSIYVDGRDESEIFKEVFRKLD